MGLSIQGRKQIKSEKKIVWRADNLCDDLNNQRACRTRVRRSDISQVQKNLQRMKISKNSKISEWYSLK